MCAFIQQTKYPEPLAGNVTSPKKPIKMTFKPFSYIVAVSFIGGENQTCCNVVKIIFIMFIKDIKKNTKKNLCVC
jgi:hypothetical protein